jgi:glycosyltransferase involved in cell wall biosynthesis
MLRIIGPGMKQLRIAFLTPQYVTEGDKIGGIGTYVYRIVRALKNSGHIPEVYTLSKQLNSTAFFHEGIRVERVNLYEPFYVRLFFRIAKKAFAVVLTNTYKYICFAMALNRALKRREKDTCYDFIHCSDYFSPGLFVQKKFSRPLVVRSSWARDLCVNAEGLSDDFDEKCKGVLERLLIRRANIVYAPSYFVANYLTKRLSRKVHVVRPAFLFDSPIAGDLPWALPKRYLVHFSSYLGPIKGSDILAVSLPMVWKEEPEFTMVWMGKESLPGLFSDYSKHWKENIDKVVLLGEIRKPELYRVIQDSEATVLPSRYDNLPNTAIESFALGVPVIGPNSASFDELVEPGINGELFIPEDPKDLAKVLLKVWRRQNTWIGKPFRRPNIFDQMEPHIATARLIKIVNL